MSSITPMPDNDITILNLQSKPRSRVYFFQGNFYYPDNLSTVLTGAVQRAIKQFKKQNKELYETCRNHPEYKSKVALFDEQCGVN